MLDIKLVAVGTKMPPWVDQGCQQYCQRLRGRVKFVLCEIQAGKRRPGADLDRIARQEETRIAAALADRTHTIALDRGGQTLSTQTLAQTMAGWMQRGDRVALVIGGPDGLSADFLGRTQETWSLSAMTLAHPVARLVVAEQVYRGYAIVHGLPYHR